MICNKCKKEIKEKVLDESEEALLRLNKRIKKMIKGFKKEKNDTSKQAKR